MKVSKNNLIFKFSLSLLIPLIIFLLAHSCIHKKEEVIFEQKIVFQDDKWNRFHYIMQNIPILDTTSRYQIALDIAYLPNVSCKEIPLIFTIISPDSALSHVRPLADLSQSDHSPYSILIYPTKYFNQKGDYTFRFFQKSTQFDIDGIKSVTLKVVRIPEPRK